jgi:hypothetical protein
MMKTLALAMFALTAAAPALAQQAPAEPKKCCCDKDGAAKTDHSKMGHGTMENGTATAPTTPR